MGKFKMYLGKLPLEVDGEKLELDVRMEDKQKLLSLQNINTEAGIKKMGEIFLEILKRSYPEDPVEEIRDFLIKKFEKFMGEISIAFGWTTRKDMEIAAKSFREGQPTGKEKKVL